MDDLDEASARCASGSRASSVRPRWRPAQLLRVAHPVPVVTLSVPTGLYLATLGVLGLLIGSFLNVVIYRVPAGCPW